MHEYMKLHVLYVLTSLHNYYRVNGYDIPQKFVIFLAVEVSFSREEVQVLEGDGQVELTLVKAGVNFRDVKVAYTTSAGPGDATGKNEVTPKFVYTYICVHYN